MLLISLSSPLTSLVKLEVTELPTSLSLRSLWEEAEAMRSWGHLQLATANLSLSWLILLWSCGSIVNVLLDPYTLEWPLLKMFEADINVLSLHPALFFTFVSCGFHVHGCLSLWVGSVTLFFGPLIHMCLVSSIKNTWSWQEQMHTCTGMFLTSACQKY